MIDLTELRNFFIRHRPRLKNNSLILLACSGGPDSMGLIASIKNISPLLPYRFVVCHVNHHLRGKDSLKDEAFVSNKAKELGLDYRVCQAPVRKNIGNLEEVARDLRYRVLYELAIQAKAGAIVTAHTLEDQAETVLMNIFRGAGMDGISGMMESRKIAAFNGFLLRPLLSTSKKSIREYLKKKKISFRVDRSNKNTRFFRNWIRLKLVPLLEGRVPGVQRKIVRLAKVVRDDNKFFETKIAVLSARVLKPSSSGTLLDFGGLLRYPDSIQRRIIRLATKERVLTFENLERLRSWMAGPSTQSRQWILPRQGRVERLSKSRGAKSSRLFLFSAK